MKEHHKVFSDFLEKTGSRYTAQKEDIVEEIFKTRTHFEVEDFLDRLKKKGVHFSRATVYRTIKQLLDATLIQKITTKDGKVYYEKAKQNEQHDHVICNICGKIFEIKDPEIADILDKVCDEIGFVPEYRSIHLYGRCTGCR